MTARKPQSIDAVRAPTAGPAQRHRLALEVTRRHAATDPEGTVDLLKMLGLVTDTREKLW